MKRPLVIAAYATVSFSVCVTVGAAIYKWFEEGDRVACKANEFTFGCSTTFGWVLSGVGLVVFVGALYLWERFRGH